MRSDAATASRQQQDEYSAARRDEARRADARHAVEARLANARHAVEAARADAIHAVEARRVESKLDVLTLDVLTHADAATTIEAARHAERLRAAGCAAAAAEDDAADAIPWGINIGDWRRQRDAEAARQRDAQMRHAEADAVAIDVDADDGAAPFAIDVPAYRRELERRQRDADALAAVAAANERNLAEIVDHPLGASARRAEIAADAQLSVSHDAAAAEQSVVPVAAAAPEHAAAAAEVCAADIALWDNAYNVDIVDDAIVAMWSGQPGLQDDPVSAAADLLATQRADALTAQNVLEAAGFICTICFNAKNLQILDCGHEFCRDCITKFVSHTCPNCRQPL